MGTWTDNEIKLPDFIKIRIIRNGDMVAEQTYN